MSLSIGIDTGGTFTDLVAISIVDGAVAVHALKVPSTPDDPSIGVADALAELRARLEDDADVAVLTHGTTVATNALIEGRLAPTGMITNRGFRDIVEIARQRRPHLYDLTIGKPVPVAPRHLRIEVGGRLAATGEILADLDSTEVERAVAVLAQSGVTAVAVCFLHSYRDGSHERAVGQILSRDLSDAHVALSSEVMPEWREYERFSTTVVNAALMPVVGRYLRRLQDRIAELGIDAGPLIMQSSGGLTSIDRVSELPITSLFSGPSAGVIAAEAIAKSIGRPSVISLDVGGTSSDVCLVEDGRPAFVAERSVGGHAVKVDSVSVQSIGAGGGSVVSLDAGGFVQVGPHSAGAVPGPACYGRGGTEPTITDVNVVLGRLDPELRLGGSVAIDAAAAHRALEPLAKSIGLPVVEFAEMALRVMTSNIARAIKLISLDRGHDPREFSLMAFGGAGAMHAADVADELGMREFIVPPRPGVLCALGLLGAAQRADARRTLLLPLDEDDGRPIAAAYADIELELRRRLASQGIDADRLAFTWSADVSFEGQDHEITVPIPQGRDLEPAEVDRRFRAAYELAYAYLPPNARSRIVSGRVTAQGERLFDLGGLPQGSAAAVSTRPARDVYFGREGGWMSAEILDAFQDGVQLHGPIVAQQEDATIVVPPGWLAERTGLTVIVRRE